MKQKVLTLIFVIGTVISASARAQASFFVCTTIESGTVLMGNLGGEANVDNVKILTPDKTNTQEVQVDSVDLSGKFLINLTLLTPEERVIYQVKAAKNDGISMNSVVTSQAGESTQKEKAVCVVKFKAAK